MSEDTAPNTPGQALQPETENASDKLGERLRRLRKEAGWTLQDLARRSGTRRVAIRLQGDRERSGRTHV